MPRLRLAFSTALVLAFHLAPDSPAAFAQAPLQAQTAPAPSASSAADLAEMGRAAYLTGDVTAAEGFLRAARAAESEPNSPRMGRILNDLGVALKRLGRYEEAAEVLSGALRIAEADPETPPAALAARMINIAELNAAAGRSAEVSAYYRRAMEILNALHEDRDLLAGAMNNFGAFHMDQGRPAAAEPLLRDALELRRQIFGESAETADTLVNLAELERQTGRLQEAAVDAEAALRIYRALGLLERPAAAAAMNTLGHLRMAAGQPQNALPLFERALEINKAALGPRHPQTGYAELNLGALFESQRRYVSAETHYEQALQILRASLGDLHPQTRRIAQTYNGFLTRYARFIPGRISEKIEAIAEVFGPLDQDAILPASGRSVEFTPTASPP